MAKRTPGRPRGGLRVGERVTDYASYSLRLPLESKLALQAASAVTRVPIWRLIADAISAHVEGLPPAQRRQVAELVKQWGREEQTPE